MLSIELGVDFAADDAVAFEVLSGLRCLTVQVNGTPAFGFTAEGLAGMHSGSPAGGSTLRIGQVNWELPEFMSLVESSTRRISRELGIESGESQRNALRVLEPVIQQAWQKAFLIRASDLLTGNPRMLTQVVFEEKNSANQDFPVFTYEQAPPPAAAFMSTAIKFAHEDLQLLYRQMSDSLALHNQFGSRADEWLYSAVEEALQDDLSSLVGILGMIEQPEPLTRIASQLEDYRDSWQQSKEISTLLAFGMDELVHIFSRFISPVMQVMNSLQTVGPLRQLGANAEDRDSWQSLLAHSQTQALVNRWLAQLGMDYEVVRAQLIDEEQLEAAKARAAAAAEIDVAARLIIILDHSMKDAGLNDEQARSVRSLLRARVQEAQLQDAIGPAVTDTSGEPADKVHPLDQVARQLLDGSSGLTFRLRQRVDHWFPKKQTLLLQDTFEGISGLLRDPEAQPQPVRTNQNPSVLKLRDKRSGLMLDDTDLGVGVSQVLPVLARAAHPGLVIIEQPELHVHPALQAHLADIMIEAANRRGTTLLLETHSEHLILRLLRRIRETVGQELETETLRFTPDDLSVLFVHPPQAAQAAIIRSLPITPDGEVVGRWPQGFFADRSEDLL
ncbi:AAA family ATPase [Deinococcus navajonensis]|uniref:AAA family ATPase n=1 Tax=Deinococcus navajonensis TaxID=309884 RepID=A0ABV8XPX7_9DEIO